MASARLNNLEPDQGREFVCAPARRRSRYVRAGLAALALAAAALMAAGPIRAQATSGALTGIVVDHETGKPLQSVRLLLAGDSLQALSDASGRFHLANLSPGRHRLVAELLGYASRTFEVDVQANGVTELRIRMGQSVVELPPVDVVVRSQWLTQVGFYDRRETGATAGIFLTRADIERRSPRQLTDVLDDYTFARVVQLDPGRYHVRFNRHVSLGGQSRGAVQPSPLDQLGCEPDLYVDGVRQRNSTPPMTTSLGARFGGGGAQNKVDDFNVIGITAVGAIEIYVGSRAPVQYDSPCGVILVWTRRT